MDKIADIAKAFESKLEHGIGTEVCTRLRPTFNHV